MWAGTRRSARMPPCTRGCRVLTRPSSISGEPVTSSTSCTGDAGGGDLLGRGAGGDDLDAGVVQALRELLQTGLVVDRNQCPADGNTVDGYTVKLREAHKSLRLISRRGRGWWGCGQFIASARRPCPARRSVKRAAGPRPGHVEFSQEAKMNTYTTVPSGEQVVQELPWRWKVQGRIFLIGGLGFMFDAWDVTLNGILIPLLSKHWSLSPGDAAWIGTANLIGMALGAFIWGTIADTIGRKKAFTATLLIFSIFTVLGAFSPDFVWFCRVPVHGRVRPGRLHPGGLCAGGRVHPPQAARPGPHGDGRLVADRRRPLRFRLRRAGRGLRGLAADHAGHGAPGAAGVLDPPQRAGIPAVPDPQGPPRRGREGDRRPGRTPPAPSPAPTACPRRRTHPGSPPAAPGRSCARSGSSTGRSRRRPGPCSSASCWCTTCR